MKRFLLIGLDLKAGAACMRYAKKRGLSVVLADTAENLALIPDLVAQAEDTLEFDFKNVAEALAVVERYHAEKPLDGVFTYREFAVLTVAHLAAALGLPGNSAAAIERIRNKHLCHSLEDALAVFGAVSRDAWIVKPPAAFGSIGVSLVHSEEELAAAIARLHGIGEPSFRRGSQPSRR